MLGNQSVKNDKPQVKAATKTQGKENQDISNSTTFAESKAREELPGSKAKYEKGMELYKQGKVSINGDGLFKVSGFYKVDTGKMKCECPDYKNNHRPCKHLFACLLFVKNRGKQKIEHLGSPGNSSIRSYSQGESNRTAEPKPKDSFNKSVEGHNRDFDRQSIITHKAGLSEYRC